MVGGVANFLLPRLTCSAGDNSIDFKAHSSTIDQEKLILKIKLVWRPYNIILILGDLPMKKMIILMCCIALSACGHLLPHQPNTNAIDPAKTIERIIKSQPPSYTTVPYEISVTKDCIQMRLAEERRKPKRVDDISKTICFENIGKVMLYKTNIFYVEIYDRFNNWMYTVYSFEESKAKNFIDALYTMMKAQ